MTKIHRPLLLTIVFGLLTRVNSGRAEAPANSPAPTNTAASTNALAAGNVPAAGNAPVTAASIQADLDRIDAEHKAWSEDHKEAEQIFEKVVAHLHKHESEYTAHLKMVKAYAQKSKKDILDAKTIDLHRKMMAEHEEMKEHHAAMMAKIRALEGIYHHHHNEGSH